MRLFCTTTHDFSDGEIADTKRLSQLYMDVSSKAFPDDFSSDLRKLVLEAECRTCAEITRCPGCYGARAEDAFVRDEAPLRVILRRLQGDVLDVGAGHAPYAGELEPAVRVGAARYLALDPDAERLSVLRSRYPWAEARAGTLGDLAAEGRRFRHILFLRSYNHLPDRDAVAGRVLELLEPEGTLLVADDVAFGLLRTSEQARRAETGPAKFEHFENESASEAHARFARHPLKLLARRDVEPEGSNLWFLHYQMGASRDP